MLNPVFDAMANRRQFLGTSAVAGAASLAMVAPRTVHAQGTGELRIGLIGCGGRGTGAAGDAMKADPNCRVVAMGDAFEDPLQNSLKTLSLGQYKDRVDVTKDRQFVGLDAYQKVIDCGVDVVLLCSTPHFRPMQLDYAIKAGKHVFCEKPVAVDSTGVRKVLETCKLAKEKNLNVVSGLCYRYEPAKRALIEEIHAGKIGDVRAIQTTYLTGGLWHRGRKPEWSEMEFQIRNWLYFTWLSGDHNNEQHIHSLDKAAWVMKDEPPVKCSGIGGRQVRTDEKYGNIYDHFSVTYEYANGTKVFAACRQMSGCTNNVNDYVWGTKGFANIMKHTYEAGETNWKYTGENKNMYTAEHEALFGAIRKGEAINNGQYMCQSTLMAIMGRMSAYTGKDVTWKEAMESKEDLTPKEYAWGPVVGIDNKVAMPGA
jgi:myo-inositol 2-dehydrogenase / D-chiro-inositol 1-dehydrogenase